MNWQQVLEDKSLQDLPYKIELNRWGQIVMSPAKRRHSGFQGKIEYFLRKLRPEGEVFPECPIDTSDNVKVADAVWVSPERYKIIRDEDICSIAPEICVEVKSPSNNEQEIMAKKSLYLEAGAIEYWVCQENGAMSFYNKDGKLATSVLVPGFPGRIEI